MFKKLTIIVLAFCISAVAALAQNMSVTGHVTDESGDPLIGAAVMVHGTTTGVITDVDGYYKINVAKGAILTVSSLGYLSESAPANDKVVNFVLGLDSNNLEESTVVAFGTKRKQDLVGSVTTVKSSLVANTKQSSVSNALEGAVAGVQIISGTGQPGSDASIIVRGVGSINAGTGALIVVDGSPFNGKLSDINPNDIESMTVSKDAVSNSLYGSRASGGVVMITTKSGAKGKPVIRFDANAGVVSRAYKDYSMVTDPAEFYKLTWYGIRNTEWAAGKSLDEAATIASSSLLEELGNYNAFIIPQGEYLVNTDGTFNPNAKVRYNDSFADAMFKNSSRQEYNFSASGKSDKSDYYLSLGYLDNQSYIVGSSYNRLSARVNVNSQLKSWLRVGLNFAAGKTTSKGLNESSSAASNPFATARSWAPIYPVHAYDLQGNLKYNEDGTPMYDAGTGQTDGTRSRPTATNQNVICNLYEDIRESQRHTLNTRAFAEFTFLKNFKFNSTVSYDYTNNQSVTYYTPTIGDGQSFGGRGTHEMSNGITLNTDQILSYDNIFGSHSVSAKVGHEYYKYHSKYLGGQKTNFFDPKNPELDNGGPMQDLSSYTKDHNIEGFFGMIDYNYASRYYASASFRRDGTSRFLNKWGNFWSAAAGWRISAEPFMENVKFVNDLKLRASYGSQGNESVSNYTPYQDLYSVTWDGSNLGFSYYFYGNPNLTWEKQNTFDIGLDYRFFNRISGSVEYFNRYTYDMIFSRPLPESSGRPSNLENIGDMRNTGIEFDITFDILKKKDLSWSVSVLGSSYKNTILTLPDENKEDGITSGTFKLFEGKSRYEYFTYQYAGMNENGAPTWYKDELDDNGDPTGNKITTEKYSEATKYWLGKSALPKFTGGLNTNFAWKGFDLMIATAFQLGGYSYDSNYVSGMSISYYVGHNSDLWDTWNPETQSGKYPIWNGNNSSNSYSQTSDAHLVSASYFSLKNVTFGYTLPAKVSQKLLLNSIRVYCSMENAALFTARQGFDPRISMSGNNSSFGGYSPMKTISGGIQLVF